MDYFGPRIGFLKFKLDARWVSDGSSLPGIVFMRGNAVAVLVLLRPEEGLDEEPLIVMVRQPRIPAATLDSWEMPAGIEMI